MCHRTDRFCAARRAMWGSLVLAPLACLRFSPPSLLPFFAFVFRENII
jgi:hypothetical protein